MEIVEPRKDILYTALTGPVIASTVIIAGTATAGRSGSGGYNLGPVTLLQYTSVVGPVIASTPAAAPAFWFPFYPNEVPRLRTLHASQQSTGARVITQEAEVVWSYPDQWSPQRTLHASQHQSIAQDVRPQSVIVPTVAPLSWNPNAPPLAPPKRTLPPEYMPSEFRYVGLLAPHAATGIIPVQVDAVDSLNTSSVDSVSMGNRTFVDATAEA